VSKVRWNVAGEIILAWILTIPSTALLAALFKLALTNVMGP
jgi:phosphate/sulfate permease